MAHVDPEHGGPASTDWRSAARTETQPPLNGRARDDGVHGGPVRDATFQELVGRLINDFSELVDRQIELAKQEVREDIGEGMGAVKSAAIGAGIAAAVGLLLLIWAWTAFIWFFNWVGSDIIARFWLPGLGWLFSMLGWFLGLLVPAAFGWFVGYQRFIKRGIKEFNDLRKRPLERTRETLKEDLEWLRSLRTPSTR